MVSFYSTMSRERVINEVMKLENILGITVGKWTEKELKAMPDGTLYRRFKMLEEWRSQQND